MARSDSPLAQYGHRRLLVERTSHAHTPDVSEHILSQSKVHCDEIMAWKVENPSRAARATGDFTGRLDKFGESFQARTCWDHGWLQTSAAWYRQGRTGRRARYRFG